MSADIIKYMPFVLADIEEFQQITSAENPEFDRIENYQDKWLKNRFVKSADEDGIKLFEELLKLKPLKSDTLEDRRLRVLAKLNERLPYTEIKLHRMLAAICGWDGYELTLEDLVLTVYLAMESNSQTITVFDLLNRVVPMNVLLRIVQLVETYCGVTVGSTSRSMVDLTVSPYQKRDTENSVRIAPGLVIQNYMTLTVLPYQGLEAISQANVELDTAVSNFITLTVRPLEEM